MIYFDTSFLVPLIIQEATTADIVAFTSGLGHANLAVSHWTRVEFASLISRRVRMKKLDPAPAARAAAGFEALVETSFSIIAPTIEDFDLARRYLARADTGLRAGDALHLAIAANRSASAIYTLDRVMQKAGIALGLPASFGIAAA